MTSAVRLLSRLSELHARGAWPELAVLLDGGEVVLRGCPAARAGDGVRLLRELGALALGPPMPQIGGTVAATYGPRGQPERIAGELWLEPDASGERIARIELHALPAPRAPEDRRAVRALILAPGPRILLFSAHDPGKGGRWWIAPGGGIEPGEDSGAALRRELSEEVGLSAPEPGPCVWTRTHTFVWGERVLRQHERYFVVEVPDEFPVLASQPDEGTLGHRWWRPEEMDTTDEIFAPRRLPALLAALLRDGLPQRPVDAGV